MKFMVLLRVEMCQNDETLEVLKDAGAFRIFFGVESGDEAQRREILDRKMTDKTIQKAFDLCRKHGLETLAVNMSGVHGETEEIIKLLPALTRLNCTLIAITGNLKSTLALRSDFVLDVGVKEEAGGNGLLPTSSTTAMVAMGDALVVAYLELHGFKDEVFAHNHPGGSLGRKMLTTIGDLMHTGEQVPIVYENSDLSVIISEMTQKRLGVTLITNKKKQLKGIITDGDLRRMIEDKKDISKIRALDLSKSFPKWLEQNNLATKAVQLMEEYSITSLVVSANGKKIDGIIHLHDLLKAGII